MRPPAARPRFPLDRRSIQDDLAYWVKRLGRLARRPLEMGRAGVVLLAIGVAGVLTLVLLEAGLAREAAFMAGVFVLAGVLWVTEALPLFATALLVIGLEVILLANPGGWAGLGFEEGPSPPYQTFLAPLSDPIIWLFLGGLLIAAAAVKEGVDEVLAGIILHPFRGSPRRVMLGLMVVTAGFSMVMSNTATTAMMLTVAAPVLAQLPPGDPARKGIVLSIPFAANIGGMGTPISSPPNAVAIGFLAQAGVPVSFLGWMLVAVPLAALLLVMAWALLARRYRTSAPRTRLEAGGGSLEARGAYVLGVIMVTVLLWLTEGLHGLPPAVVALLPVVAFTAPGVLGREDFNTLQWHILVLIAGGIALGVGMQATGLDDLIVRVVPVSPVLVLLPLTLATLVLSTVMSNTAAANLLLPVGVALAATGAGPSVLEAGVAIALAASVAMALPVSTPPNAIAFASGELEARDLAVNGGIVGLIGLVFIVLFGGPIIRFWLGG
jgi:solute carrier family 13 (sodium-dependent dicarboxylate transporter), member 2/3/5